MVPNSPPTVVRRWVNSSCGTGDTMVQCSDGAVRKEGPFVLPRSTEAAPNHAAAARTLNRRQRRAMRTIQKAEGETPGNRAARFDQLRKDAASAMRAAVALLESGHATEAAKLLADALPKVDADGLPPGAAEYLERLLRKQKASDAFRDTLADIPAENAPYTAASDGKEEP